MKSKSNKKEKAKELFENVVNYVKNIVNNGEYENFLKFQKNFAKYSFCNRILIYTQFPDATEVAGKKDWEDRGRELIPGAQKIKITAGIPKKVQKKVKKIVDEEEIEEIKTYNYMSYISVYVYDISETIIKGEQIQTECKVIDNANMAYFYEKLKSFSKVPVYEKELEGRVKGYYNTHKKEIIVKKTLPINDKAAVLLHELAHSLYDDFDYKTNRNLSEVFVESIAYIVAYNFGLDTSLCSFKYISGWANGDPKVVISLGSKIQKCANQFIESIEKFEIQETELVA